MSVHYGPPHPVVRNNPALWIDFSDARTLFDATTGGSLVTAGGAIARVEDKSGNGRHLINSNLSTRPTRTIASIKGRDVATYTSTSRLENTTATIGLAERSVYAVFVQDVSGDGVGIVTVGYQPNALDYNHNRGFVFSVRGANLVQVVASSSYILNSGGTGPTPLGIYSDLATAGLGQLFFDGVLKASDNAFTAFAATSDPGISVGCRKSGISLSGRLCEVLYFERKLSVSDDTTVRNYLREKWI